MVQAEPHLDQVAPYIFCGVHFHICTSTVLDWVSTSVFHPSSLRLRRASSTFPWLGRLALPNGFTSSTHDERYSRYQVKFVVEQKTPRHRALTSIRFSSVELQLWHHPHIRRHMFYSGTWICPCWLLPTGTIQIHIIPTGYEPRGNVE